MAYQCEECGAEFAKLSRLLQHRRLQNHWKYYVCPSCKKVFNRKDNLDRHLKKHADENSHHCPECLKVFTRKDALDAHVQQEHGYDVPKQCDVDQRGGSSLKKRKVDGIDPTNFYRIERISERTIEKFKTSATYYKIYMKDIEVSGLVDILKARKNIFQSIIDNTTRTIQFGDLVRLSIDNPQLDFPIVLPFMRRSELTVNRLLSEIERVLQSYDQFVLDETLGIELVCVHMPNENGNKRKPYVDISRMLQDKKGLIQIRNTDDLCCARAIATAIARHEKHPQWNSICVGGSIQHQLAINLHNLAGIPLQKCGLAEVKQFSRLTKLSNTCAVEGTF